MNNETVLNMPEGTKWELVRQCDMILTLMQLEHEHAHTHAQRNNYQAVIRHELEILRDRVSFSRSNVVVIPSESDIPF